jgi:hypothetical protein
LVDFITAMTKLRPAASRWSRNLGEKDERRVNEAMPSYAGLTRVSIHPFQRIPASSPAMTTYVPLGLTRRVGMAFAGSSGQG